MFSLVIPFLMLVAGIGTGLAFHDELLEIFRFGPDGAPEDDRSYSNFDETEVRQLAFQLKIVDHSEMGHAELLAAIRAKL